MKFRLIAVFLAMASLLAGSPSTAAPRRSPVPREASPPAAKGRIVTLDLDASEVARKILHAKLTIPVQPGPVVLYYPKWIPGEHGPTGPVTDLAGLRLSAGGRTIPWVRDDADMYAFKCDVPAGATELSVSLDFLMPPSTVEGFSSASSSTTELATFNWNQVLLYPAGTPVREILYRASLTLPPGWKLGTPLQADSTSGRRTVFRPVSLETLVDSPVICGAHFLELPIGADRTIPHFVEMAAESDEALQVPPETRAAYDRLVAEAEALFGARHYRSYRFLFALSDGVAHFGLEHHESSDDRVPERTLLEEDLRRAHATLLTHEFVHSWNGKYRRPADIATPDFQQPMRTSLLWVYEGLTQYLGDILAARSGLWTPEEYREKLALIAEWAGDHAGRNWRPLADTAVSAQLLFPARSDWEAWRRSVDFYDESVLIWLDADTLIRERSHGARSLEDFLHDFHGGESGPPKVVPYTFDDVVAAMNRVLPYDWAAFFHDRVDSVAPHPPLAGLERSGWRLTFSETPSTLQKSYDKSNKETDLSASLGIVVEKDGTIKDVIPGKPAEHAGVGPSMKIIAVNTRRWSGDSPEEVLLAAVAATMKSAKPLELLLENGEFIRTYALDYHGGARYPRLERIGGKEDSLSSILKSRS
jgi:predicted metalloprotease with PDZ domain